MVHVTVTRASPAQLAVRFLYDESILAVVKSIPGRTWNQRAHAWFIPANPDSLDILRERTPRYASVRVADDVLADIEQARRAIADAAAVRAAGDADIAHPYVTEPYAHQRAGLAFLAHLGSGALLWEMGLGKTKTAIDYAEWLMRGSGRRSDFGVLVIAPNTVKRNWGTEIEKHAGHRDFVIPEGTLEKRAAAFGTSTYTIVNCEQLSYRITAKALQQFEWDLVIVDESTRFKTPSAARTRVLHKLRTKHRVILTGTPITGKPEDAWSQLEFVAPGTFGTYYHFRDRYLELDFWKHVVGIRSGSAGDELRRKIAARSYRILKADVLDLPPKVYTTRTVELSGLQAKAYAQMRDDLRVAIEGNPELLAPNILTMLLRLTQITAGLIGDSQQGYTWIEDGAKVKELDDLIRDELRGEQVVIFGLYQKELEALARRYASGQETNGHPPIIYGPTPERVRHDLVSEFQIGDRRLLFCQVRTGGIGINLTAAQTAVYATRGWSLEEWLQSQDRLHRIGQRGTVTIVPIVAKGTVDEDIADALADKQQMADYLTGDGARQLAARVLRKKP